jgi:hypothetical protein
VPSAPDETVVLARLECSREPRGLHDGIRRDSVRGADLHLKLERIDHSSDELSTRQDLHLRFERRRTPGIEQARGAVGTARELGEE